ncbi:hypothetical protein VTI74DRAFT_9992 [Chaetomium olivicolor]
MKAMSKSIHGLPLPRGFRPSSISRSNQPVILRLGVELEPWLILSRWLTKLLLQRGRQPLLASPLHLTPHPPPTPRITHPRKADRGPCRAVDFDTLSPKDLSM